MAVNVKAIGASMAAIIGAAGIAAANLPALEGWVLVGYADPAVGAKLATDCAGVTKGAELGRKRTDAECKTRTAQALIEHGFGIAPCLPDELPPNTRAAFTDLAYNIGVGNFCSSKTAALAKAGDLRASCQAIYGWCKQCAALPGLKKRRDYEVSLCLSGLK